MASAGEAIPAQPEYTPPPLSVQQEDAIIHTRITNDEKALRRVTRKFHTYASVAYPPLVPLTPSGTSSVEDARDTFLLELASFQLSLKKSLMVCEAEARQVEEYQNERERIANERSRLKDQIEDLKETLEQAQLERKRKIEYDVIAEKVNTLPTRDELEQSIRSLENDMAAIRAEHDNQNRVLHAQKAALDTVIHDINVLRLMGKDEESGEPTPTPETQPGDDVEMDGTSSVRTREESGELREDGISRAASTIEKAAEEAHDSDEDIPLSKVVLNPAARASLPKSRTSSPLVPLSRTASSAPLRAQEEEEEDIEMGEIGEEPARGRKKIREEELEEGEASDESSELSEPPDD